MKVRVTFDFTRDERLAVANFFGDSSPVSHAHMKRWAEGIVDGELENLRRQLDAQEEAERGTNHDH